MRPLARLELPANRARHIAARALCRATNALIQVARASTMLAMTAAFSICVAATSAPNPYEQLARQSNISFDLTSSTANRWRYRGVAEAFLSAAWAACLANKEEGRQKAQPLAKVVDYLVNGLQSGAWWTGPPTIGDPNVNRFVLAPLLDGLFRLRECGLLPNEWQQWKVALRAAVQLQVKAYRGEINWDWGGKAGGHYANQDAMYALIVALASKLFADPMLGNLGDTMIDRVVSQQMSDGGFHYIGTEVESPVYNALVVSLLGRYYELTGNKKAIAAIGKSAKYWRLTLTAEGQAEHWTDVWWKQSWGFSPTDELLIVGNASRDPYLEYLLKKRVGGRAEIAARSTLGPLQVVASHWWYTPGSGSSPPKKYVTPDNNIRGIRGRDGDWYFGVAQGRGLRNTFVGGMISASSKPLDGVFRGAQISVKDADSETEYWLSELIDRSTLIELPGVGGALCVSYTLQRSMFHASPPVSTKPTPWSVTQLWLATKNGVLGKVSVRPHATLQRGSISGRLLFGPMPLEQALANSWTNGPLKVRLYETFGDVSVRAIPTSPVNLQNPWDGLHIDTGTRRISSTEQFSYSVWVGPRTKREPVEIRDIGANEGWIAFWADGTLTGIVSNDTDRDIELTLPFFRKDKVNAIDSIGESSKRPKAPVDGSHRLRLLPGECKAILGNYGSYR